jgi:hypothetical protein
MSHAPPLQPGSDTWGNMHALPHDPQFDGSCKMSTSHPSVGCPLQSAQISAAAPMAFVTVEHVPMAHAPV